jgi:hypothetical protein
MNLIRRISKLKARSDRWRSPAHLAFVRKHACVVCDSESGIEAAHVRIGSDAAMGRKPSDDFAVPLCGGPAGCHQRQHSLGERSFWDAVGKDPHAIIAELIRSSPKRREIEQERASRAGYP